MGHSRWRTPTTHILKPPVSELAEFAEIEHFCLRLANEVGLPVATSAVMRVADEIAFVTSVSTACLPMAPRRWRYILRANIRTRADQVRERFSGCSLMSLRCRGRIARRSSMRSHSTT